MNKLSFLFLFLLCLLSIDTATALHNGRTFSLDGKSVDKNNDGRMSKKEFNDALSLSNDEEAILFSTSDLDGNGTLDHGEFEFAQDMVPVAQIIGATWTSYFVSFFTGFTYYVVAIFYIGWLVLASEISLGGTFIIFLKLDQQFLMWLSPWSTTAKVVFGVAAIVGIIRVLLRKFYVTASVFAITIFATWSNIITTIEMLLGIFLSEASLTSVMKYVNPSWSDIDNWANWSYTTFTKVGIDSKIDTALDSEIRFYAIIAAVILCFIATFIYHKFLKEKDPTSNVVSSMDTWKSVIEQLFSNTAGVVLFGLFALFSEYYYPNFCNYNVITDPLTRNEIVRIIVSPMIVFGMLCGTLGGIQKSVPFTKESWKRSLEDISITGAASTVAGVFEEIQFRWLLQPFLMVIISFLIWLVPIYGGFFGLFHKMDWLYSTLTFGKLDDLLNQVSDGDEIYVHAAILSDFLFAFMHAHQGWIGIIQKPIGCVYFRYFMYAYGFQGAILAHVLWDIMVLSWPHFVGMLLGIVYVPIEYYDREAIRINERKE